MNRQIFKIIISLIVVMALSTGFKAIQINSNQKFELNEYKSLVDNQDAQIKALKEVEVVINEKEQEIEALKQTQNEMNQTILDLNQNIATLKDQIATLTDKVVYLTFDDGPSKETTLEILAVLNKYSVKATFFVIGRNVVKNPTVLKEIVAQGHAVGNHSFSHNYPNIYKDEDAFWADYNKCQEAIYEVTGEYPVLFRFPGGSNTATNFKGDDFVSQLRVNLLNQGVQFFDWNIESGDAAATYASVGTIKANAYMQIAKKKNAIVLFHDSDNKKSTVEALPEIIEHYLSLGYRFDVLTPSGFTTQFK